MDQREVCVCSEEVKAYYLPPSTYKAVVRGACCKVVSSCLLQNYEVMMFKSLLPRNVQRKRENLSVTYCRWQSDKKQKSSFSRKKWWKHVALDNGGGPFPLNNGKLLDPAGYLSEQGPEVSVWWRARMQTSHSLWLKHPNKVNSQIWQDLLTGFRGHPFTLAFIAHFYLKCGHMTGRRMRTLVKRKDVLRIWLLQSFF